MEKLIVDKIQTETTTETDLGMLLNENGKDKQAADEDSEVRPSPAATNIVVVQFIWMTTRSGRCLIPFSSAKEKSLDNQPTTLLFYRPAVSELLLKNAEVAQLVEQRPEKPRVRSSILRLGTISCQQL